MYHWQSFVHWGLPLVTSQIVAIISCHPLGILLGFVSWFFFLIVLHAYSLIVVDNQCLICIFLTILRNKNVRYMYVWRSIKINPRSKILTSWDRTPVLKIPGSATIYNMILNEYSLEKRCAPVRSYFKYKHWGHYDTATPIKINIDLRSPWYREYE